MARTRRTVYRNLYGVTNDKTFADMRRWQKERRSKPKDNGFTVPQCEHKRIDWLRTNREKTTITWIGHSTFLIQCAGLNIVTDPVWAKRMGFAKRLSAPGLALHELPEIDVALISHSHYDHLHIRSLRSLPGDPVILVPEGLSRLLKSKGFAKAEEIPWWQSTTIRDVRLTMVPAQHWTRRTLWDMNTSHWGGWIIEGSGDCIYFAGDSGYFPAFREIGKKFAVDTALLPIGAYDPEWFMSVSHMSPEEAVQAFIDLGAKRFVPMHYGAFRLADDTAEQALARLHAAWEKQRLNRDVLHILKLGETMDTIK